MKYKINTIDSFNKLNRKFNGDLNKVIDHARNNIKKQRSKDNWTRQENNFDYGANRNTNIIRMANSIMNGTGHLPSDSAVKRLKKLHSNYENKLKDSRKKYNTPEYIQKTLDRAVSKLKNINNSKGGFRYISIDDPKWLKYEN